MKRGWAHFWVERSRLTFVRLIFPALLLLVGNAAAAAHHHDHDHDQRHAESACIICSLGIDDDWCPGPPGNELSERRAGAWRSTVGPAGPPVVGPRHLKPYVRGPPNLI